MKTVIIKQLSILNFKGIKNFNVQFDEKETGIWGANGTGKTTIMDAIVWLLFGKDSTDRTTFEIKTLDKFNNVIPMIDHEVEAVIEINGDPVNIKRTFREKWVKKRAALEAEFSGNVTVFHWNDVPVNASEFSSKIGNIVDERIFKLITNPGAFNSLKWQDQRQTLIDISGGITDEEIAKGNDDFENLLTKLVNKTLEEYQKQIAASVRKSKDELKSVPTRIDEVERSKPEAIDFEFVRQDIEAKEKELTSVDNQISDKLAAQQEILNKRSEKQKQIHGLKTEIEEIKHNILQEAKKQFRAANSEKETLRSRVSEKEDELVLSKNGLDTLKSKAKSKETEIDNLTNETTKLRASWNEKNAEEFRMDEGETKCPTCDREFEADKVETKKQEAKQRFDASKQSKLAQIHTEGVSKIETLSNIKKELKSLQERIEKGESHLKKLQSELNSLNEQFSNIQVTDRDHSHTEEVIYANLISENKEIPGKQSEIENLNEALANEETVNVDELNAQKIKYKEQIEEFKTKLSAKEQIEKADKRIAELSKEEQELAQVISNFEKEQYIIENFVKAKIDKLESLINNRFQMVSFKLFETQVNGSEVPTCKALINGVPFTDANNASRINAGIDIINTLCEFYEVSAPILIDNRESVTKIINTDSQIINLIVSEADSKLRIEHTRKLEPQSV